MRAKSFPAISRADAHILILGSLPGIMSLAQRQYYAHPRNGFWPIMAGQVGFSPDLPYPERLEQLLKRGIALWDVHASATREGSLDSAIRDDEQNDFRQFFKAHRHIKLIGFNGNMAAKTYLHKILPGLPQNVQAIPSVLLPSTSTAYASMTLQQKMSTWKRVLTPYLPHVKHS